MKTEQVELKLYTDNTSELYPARQSIERMLVSAKRTGKYNRSIAIVMWVGWYKSGARSYMREHCAPGDRMIFSNDDVRISAVEMADYFETEYNLGNHK